MREEERWWAWGSPDQQYPPERLGLVLRFLKSKGIGFSDSRDSPDLPAVPASRLRAADLETLEGVVEIALGDMDRLTHSLGQSYLDLLQARLGQVGEFTDAVAYPKNGLEVKRLLEIAASRGIAIVPYGGGTSVLGGLKPFAGRHHAVVTVDLHHLNSVPEIDEVSLLARVEAGISGPELEEALQAVDLTLGHYPQSFHYSTLGGWIATRASGHLSGEYGRMEDIVQAVHVLTPEGPLETKSVPARSAGPGVKDLVLGSEGVLGVIVQAVVRVRRKPEAHRRRALLVQDFSTAIETARQMVQAGVLPALFRISDEEESGMIAWLAGMEAEDVPSVVLLGYEGTEAGVANQMQQAVEFWTAAGALDIGEDPAATWEEEYYRAPYLRDELLARNLLVDTLETAASWSKLEAVYRRVRRSIQKAYTAQNIGGLVLCHVSHLYRDGGSLYYTLLAPRLKGREVEQWWEIKEAATLAILEEGGTISHHHGVGMDHLRWMTEEHGEAALKGLRALKDAVDPQGIMNPGKVVDLEYE